MPVMNGIEAALHLKEDGSSQRCSTESCGSWVRGPVARATREISAVLDLPPPLPAVGREGRLERILRALAEELQARRKLELEEALIDASFTGARKGASRSGPRNAAKGRSRQ